MLNMRLGHRGHRDEHRGQADHAVEERHQLGHLGHLDRLGAPGAIGTAGNKADEHPHQAAGAALGELDVQRSGGDHCDGHTDHAEQVAADGRWSRS